MSKLLKKRMAQELSGELKAVNSFVIFSFTKLKPQQSHSLRKEMRSKNIRVKVIKNRLAARAFSQLYQVQMKHMLKGPTAIAYGGESTADIAKALQDWNKKEKILEIKGGYIPSRLLEKKDMDLLSRLPPKPVLYSMLAGSFNGLLRQVATMVKAPLQNMANALHSMADKMQKETSQNAANPPKEDVLSAKQDLPSQ
jgi:large subunit ribosomal protein L10